MKNKNVLTLYFADLTHDQILIANAMFPLGIGYVASALKAIFKDEIEVDLFKYPSNLDAALKDNPPDIYLFSNYMWNQNINLFYAKKVKELFPGTLIISGGPNMSSDVYERKKFLEDHPYLDLFILGEGEVPACSIIREYIDLGKSIPKLKEGELSSALTLLPDGSIKEGVVAPRIGTKRSPKETYTAQWNTLDDSFNSLEDVPSPYVTGLMDKFFDNRLFPLVETNRGCPFACSFCQRGEDYFNRTTMRPLGMIKEELDYIAHNMIKKSTGVFKMEFADSNFAMFKQDLEICKHLRGLQDKHSWPSFVNCSTGKNKPELVIEAVSTLKPNSLVVSNAMQSNNTETLKAIKRENISLEKYTIVQTEIQKRGLRSKADLIIGLPEETKETHFAAIYDLIDSGVQEFSSYQAQILKDTELGSKDKRDSHGFKTKFRLIPYGLGLYEGSNGSSIVPECEEIIIATNTLSFEDYLDARRMHLIDSIFHNSGIFNLIYSYLENHHISFSRFIERIYLNSFQADFPLEEVLVGFAKETKGELFDSEESCAAFYSKPENLECVKKAEAGGNVLFQYLSIALFEKWVSTVEVALIALQDLVPECENELEDLAKILNVRVVDITQTPIKKSISIKLSSQEIIELINKTGYNLEQDSSGDAFFTMELSDSQYKVLSHAKTVYPQNRAGRSLVLRMHRVLNITRDIKVDNSFTMSCRE